MNDFFKSNSMLRSKIILELSRSYYKNKHYCNVILMDYLNGFSESVKNLNRY